MPSVEKSSWSYLRNGVENVTEGEFTSEPCYSKHFKYVNKHQLVDIAIKDIPLFDPPWMVKRGNFNAVLFRNTKVL